jgi:hypothetical protein
LPADDAPEAIDDGEVDVVPADVRVPDALLAGLTAGPGMAPAGRVPTGAERHAARLATQPIRRDGSLRTMITPKYYRFHRPTDTTEDDPCHPKERPHCR